MEFVAAESPRRLLAAVGPQDRALAASYGILVGKEADAGRRTIAGTSRPENELARGDVDDR
jgi:hypothetical protein